jgi:hypothetical protein
MIAAMAGARAHVRTGGHGARGPWAMHGVHTIGVRRATHATCASSSECARAARGTARSRAVMHLVLYVLQAARIAIHIGEA